MVLLPSRGVMVPYWRPPLGMIVRLAPLCDTVMYSRGPQFDLFTICGAAARVEEVCAVKCNAADQMLVCLTKSIEERCKGHGCQVYIWTESVLEV